MVIKNVSIKHTRGIRPKHRVIKKTPTLFFYFRNTTDPFFLSVTVDIGTADYYDKEEILSRVRREVIERTTLGPYTTDGDMVVREFEGMPFHKRNIGNIGLKFSMGWHVSRLAYFLDRSRQ